MPPAVEYTWNITVRVRCSTQTDRVEDGVVEEFDMVGTEKDMFDKLQDIKNNGLVVEHSPGEYVYWPDIACVKVSRSGV